MGRPANSPRAEPASRSVRLFLCGDVMTGRGLDQILRSPCDPRLYEEGAISALGYVKLAEAVSGPVPRGAGPAYIWGAALDELDRMRPDARIINLETSITRDGDPAPKGINYRMSPENADCLKAAAIDCCVLANNHTLDWGLAGLADTLATLQRLRIAAAGAGSNSARASAPAVLDCPGIGRVLVFSFACTTSGTPRRWAATAATAGVNLLGDLSRTAASRVAKEIAATSRPGDLVVVSVHWGPNWGYEITEEQQDFAHALIDEADVSIIHGHSSHHPKAVEIYRNRLVIYGCGDFLNDYEGISGYERYRDDLVLMYFADLDPVRRELCRIELVPLQIRKFQLTRPAGQDVGWLMQRLDREYRKFGVRIVLEDDGHFVLYENHGAQSM